MKNNSWSPPLPPFRAHKKRVFQDLQKTAQFIFQIGETDLLRKPAPEVDPSTILFPTFQRKIVYLKQCLQAYRKLTGMGRGITGVQIGIPVRTSVIYMPEVRGNMLIIINPKITKQSREFLLYPEMCMSACPIIAHVPRPAWIEFEYIDEFGNKQYWDKKATSNKGKIYNRVFQHEIDHMDGIINIDKVNSSTLILECDPTFYERATFIKVKKV